MLEGLTRDLRSGTRQGLLSASRRAYGLALAALALPGVLLGAGLLAGRPDLTPLSAALVLYVLAVGLAGWALRRATQLAARTDLPARQTALTAAIQAATAPGVVFLLGCTLVRQPLVLAGFWITALLLHARIWTWLPAWVRDPEPALTDERLPPS